MSVSAGSIANDGDGRRSGFTGGLLAAFARSHPRSIPSCRTATSPSNESSSAIVDLSSSFAGGGSSASLFDGESFSWYVGKFPGESKSTALTVLTAPIIVTDVRRTRCFTPPRALAVGDLGDLGDAVPLLLLLPRRFRGLLVGESLSFAPSSSNSSSEEEIEASAVIMSNLTEISLVIKVVVEIACRYHKQSLRNHAVVGIASLFTAWRFL